LQGAQSSEHAAEITTIHLQYLKAIHGSRHARQGVAMRTLWRECVRSEPRG
jgi:hypothetical protein